MPRVTGLLGAFVFLFTVNAHAEFIYQNFESDNGSGQYGWAIGGAQVEVSSEQVCEDSAQSLKLVIANGIDTGAWEGAGIPSQTQTWHVDFQPQVLDRLIFRVWAQPSNGQPNTVAVKFFDHGDYVYDPANGKDGFLVWTTTRAVPGEWTKMEIPFTQLPSQFNLADVDKIEFYNYFPGTYYYDDMTVVRGERIYQSFEPDRCSGATDCGWAWGGVVELAGDIVYEGTHSWKLQTGEDEYWAGTGIRSQEKRCQPRDVCTDQDYWHVDLVPEHLTGVNYDRLTFQVHASAANGLGNTVGVQFFDWGNYYETPATIWTQKVAVDGVWTKLEIPFSSLPQDFDLHDVNKIQFQVYWPGTYYFDDIRTETAAPEIVLHQPDVSNTVVSWDAVSPESVYTLEESVSGPLGPWETVYDGSVNMCDYTRLSESWLRVRYRVEPSSPHVPEYISEWSNTVHYLPKPVLLDRSLLYQGMFGWNLIPQTGLYEIQGAYYRNGPWHRVYTGQTAGVPRSGYGRWYRIRGIREEGGIVVDATTWSPAICDNPNAFIHADGMVLRDRPNGDVIRMQGVNLGNFFMIEPWMFFGGGDTQAESFPDDYTIRRYFIERFGGEQARMVIDAYQNNYIGEHDFDNIMRLGANFIRLPLNYRDIRDLDENGEWIGTEFRFDHIDRVLAYCEDRGIYVLLDLHGAPGSQSKEFHSGRSSLEGGDFYHKLFDPSNDIYRQRTEELWRAIAQRYRHNNVVMGYDLINEPMGAIDTAYYPVTSDGYAALWDLYDRLYKVIRRPAYLGGAGDRNHVIVMEGIPSDRDWDTLPNPRRFSWHNVMYQFHYYGFDFDDEGNISGVLSAEDYEKYLISGVSGTDEWSGKVRYSKQSRYNVPVMIGEFSGFNDRAIWEMNLETFDEQGWSWAVWSYKTGEYANDWGLWGHSAAPSERLLLDDSQTFEDLLVRCSVYDTNTAFDANESLNAVLAAYFPDTVSGDVYNHRHWRNRFWRIRRFLPAFRQSMPDGSRMIDYRSLRPWRLIKRDR